MSTRLRNEVWALDRCTGCGACVSACSKGVLHWDGEQHPFLEEREKALGLSHLRLRACEVCEQFCELSCPRLAEWPSGELGEMASMRAIGVLHGCEPNDVARALSVAARSTDLVDGVLMPDIDPWAVMPVTRIASQVDEIASTAGSQYLWTPVLSSLNEAVFEKGLQRLVIVGPPCVAQGARRLVQSEHERLWPYREAIRIIIAYSCAGTYMPDVIGGLLESGLGIPRHSIQSLVVVPHEGKLVVTSWDGGQRVVPLTDVEPYTRCGCGSCDDYWGRSADLSVGSVGSAPGWATLVTNTAVGQIVVQNARRLRLVEEQSEVDTEAVIAAQAAKSRRAKAAELDHLQILALDALADPQRRAEVKRQFGDLHDAVRQDMRTKEGCGGYCDGC